MKDRLQWKGRFVAVLVLAAGLAATAQAQTVLVDFGNLDSFRGASVPNPDSNGNFWNSLQPGTPGIDLRDTTNAVTALDIYFDTGVGTDSFNGPAGPTSFPPTPAEIAATDIDAAALGNLGGALEGAFDFAASPGDDNATTGNNTRFQIQGLDPTKRYHLSFFGSHKFNVEPTTVYSIFTDTNYNVLVDSESLNVYEPGSPWLHNRDTVATISNLSPQTNDILYVQFVGETGHYGYLNAFSITCVPEPSSLLLVISGVAAVFGLRRR